jgi:DNA-binding MarR family transcriptional regulator
MTVKAQRDALRLWLRLVSTTALIERRLGAALKREFGSTLPRFDLLAQLDRAPDGLRMTELADRLLVTGGNVTWLVRALEREGLVTRTRSERDRRAIVVRRTPAGHAHFARMAAAHAGWVHTLTRGLAAPERRALADRLGVLKQHVTTLPAVP